MANMHVRKYNIVIVYVYWVCKKHGMIQFVSIMARNETALVQTIIYIWWNIWSFFAQTPHFSQYLLWVFMVILLYKI